MKQNRSFSEVLEQYLPLGQQILDWMNAHPETSGHEKQTCTYLVNLLRKYGYEVSSPVKRIKYSFHAHKPERSGVAKPKIAVLCEYDAMDTEGHSCGHSASCAAGIICALALEDAFKEFPFQLDLIGTPNEEINGCKIAMMEKGVFSGYECAILTQMSSVNYPCFQTLASSDLVIHFYGKAAHASVNPWEGVNALNGVQLFFHATDLLRPYLLPGSHVSGIVQDGGTIPNVIPDKASAYVYLRANRYEQLLSLKERIENCARGAALATENKYTTEQMNPTYAEVFCGSTTFHLISTVMKELQLPVADQITVSGSSDVGNLNLEIPVLYPLIATGGQAPLYSPEFAREIAGDPGYTGMKHGAQVMGNLLLRLAEDPDLLCQIKEEHQKYRSDHSEIVTDAHTAESAGLCTIHSHH